MADTILTDAQEKAMRDKLAASEAAKARQLYEAERDRRAAALQALQPAIATAGKFEPLLAEVKATRDALPEDEGSLAELFNNLLTVAKVVVDRAKQRASDLAPPPEPAGQNVEAPPPVEQ